MVTREWLMAELTYQLAKLGFTVHYAMNLSPEADAGSAGQDDVEVNLARSDWLATIAHEFGHVTQRRDDRFHAFDADQAQRIFSLRVEGAVVAEHEWRAAAAIVESFERDAELVALWLCGDLIDRGAYYRKANAYLMAIRLEAETGTALSKKVMYHKRVLAALPDDRMIGQDEEAPRKYRRAIEAVSRRTPA